MINIDDKYILNLFFTSKQIIRRKIINKHKDLNTLEYQYVINRFKDSTSFDESLFRIKYNIEIRPICEECGKPTNFIIRNKIKFGSQYPCFTRFCSKKCSNSNEKVRKKQQETCLKLYGDFCNHKKYIETCLKKYGVDNGWKATEIKEKLKQTWLDKYGVDNYAKLPEHQLRLNSKESKEKALETKRKNNTFNTSKPEQETYKLLLEKFPDAIKEYKEERYPFNCDFYIPSKDLFIECQYHWTHGFHPYDENNQNDLIKGTEWKNSNSKFKNHAYKTWTIGDVNKRKIARKNKINYLEIWNINDLKDWLQNNYIKNNIN